MRKAGLPDGTILSFPDGTPDEIIDATVRKYVKKEEPDIGAEEIIQEPEQAKVASVTDEIETIDGAETVKPLATEEDVREPKVDRNREAQHQLIMSTESLNMLVGSLLSEVVQMQERSEAKLDDISKILRTPRTLVKDSEGNPVGSKLAE